MNVPPVAIVQMLKSMVQKSAKDSISLASDIASSFQTPSSNMSEPSRNGDSTGMLIRAFKTKENNSKTVVKTRTKPSGKYSHKM